MAMAAWLPKKKIPPPVPVWRGDLLGGAQEKLFLLFNSHIISKVFGSFSFYIGGQTGVLNVSIFIR
jgi:hypothetical protein